MKRWRHYVTGGLATVVLSAAVALFSAWPQWRALPDGTAVLRLSFSHGGDRSATCRDLTAEEIAKLPPNMRRTTVCERRRPPLYVELDIDGDTAYRALVPPSGLAGDGPSSVYRRITLAAGAHEVAVRLRETPRTSGFDHEAVRTVELRPGQSFVIDFRKGAGGFQFQ